MIDDHALVTKHIESGKKYVLLGGGRSGKSSVIKNMKCVDKNAQIIDGYQAFKSHILDNTESALEETASLIAIDDVEWFLYGKHPSSNYRAVNSLKQLLDSEKTALLSVTGICSSSSVIGVAPNFTSLVEIGNLFAINQRLCVAEINLKEAV